MASFEGESKEPVNIQTFLADGGESLSALPEVKQGTGADAHDMYRMGKKQETKVGGAVRRNRYDADVTRSVTSNFYRSLDSPWC